MPIDGVPIPRHSDIICRRDFLRIGSRAGASLGALSIAGTLLEACGTSTTTATGAGGGSTARNSTSATTSPGASSKPSFGKFVLQLNWLAGSNWEGSYVAQKAGVYQQQGFNKGVELLYGGPNVAVEPVVESGKAFMGVCNSETFAAAVQQGASLVCIGAYLQHNPFCLASLPAKPINTPHDMIGKKIGIQALNEGEWTALLKINNISPGSVTKVIVQNDPTPLVNGEVDAFLSFVDNQPVSLELQGYKPVIMMLDNFGFALYQQLYVVPADSLRNRKNEVTAGLRAEVIGKQMVAKNPSAAVALTVSEFGGSAGLTSAFEEKALPAALQLATSPSTMAHGTMYMDPADVAKNVATLKLLGLGIPASSYTNEILDVIYAKGTTLI